MNATKRVIEELTGKQVKSITELAFVFSVTFVGERPTFIGKKQISQYAQAMNADDLVALEVRKEWEIHPGRKAVTDEQKLEVLRLRMLRAGFTCPQKRDGKVFGCIPSDKFDAEVAIQIAKESGWLIKNGQCIAA